jgi:transposase
MFSLGSSHRYLLYHRACDMRKSFDGLSGIVSGELGREPTNGDVFVFLNKRRSHIKLLHWEKDGFVLYYKRLEKGTFAPPRPLEDGSLSWPELVLMTEGIKVEKMVRKNRYHVCEK